MSIIGDYQNLTWSGGPDGSVSLNGPDNTVGTTRTYDVGGLHVVETITEYSKPPNGPFNEVHILAPLTFPSLNIAVYGDFDATTCCSHLQRRRQYLQPYHQLLRHECEVGSADLHQIHLTDAQTVGVFLGGKNFTSCAEYSDHRREFGCRYLYWCCKCPGWEYCACWRCCTCGCCVVITILLAYSLSTHCGQIK